MTIEKKEPRMRYALDLQNELSFRLRTILNIMLAPQKNEQVMTTLSIFLAEYSQLAAKSVEKKTWERKMLEVLRGWIERNIGRKGALCKGVQSLLVSFERVWALDSKKTTSVENTD